MKKAIFLWIFLFSVLGVHAQYAEMDAMLTYLEQRRGIKNLEKAELDNKKFIRIKEFDDYTERNVLIFNGDKVTYVEMFDDKSNGQTSSNVFTGDMVKNNKGVISIRCDYLEGKKIPLAVTKTFLPHQQRKIIYLVDMNTQERWIDEYYFSNKKELEEMNNIPKKSKKAKR